MGGTMKPTPSMEEVEIDEAGEGGGRRRDPGRTAQAR